MAPGHRAGAARAPLGARGRPATYADRPGGFVQAGSDGLAEVTGLAPGAPTRCLSSGAGSQALDRHRRHPALAVRLPAGTAGVPSP